MEKSQSDAESYHSWAELAGYFDGDGTVEFSVDRYTIHIRLAFDENWKLHLVGIANFLNKRGILAGRVRKKESFNTWHIVVSNIEGVKRMAKAMISHTVKKRRELEAVLAYFEDETTGNEFVRVMNSEVLSGQRTGRLRDSGPRLTHSGGVRESRRMGESRRRMKRLTSVPLPIVNRILEESRTERVGLTALSRRYGYFREILRRIISDERNSRQSEEHKKRLGSASRVGR